MGRLLLTIKATLADNDRLEFYTSFVDSSTLLADYNGGNGIVNNLEYIGYENLVLQFHSPSGLSNSQVRGLPLASKTFKKLLAPFLTFVLFPL